MTGDRTTGSLPTVRLVLDVMQWAGGCLFGKRCASARVLAFDMRQRIATTSSLRTGVVSLRLRFLLLLVLISIIGPGGSAI